VSGGQQRGGTAKSTETLPSDGVERDKLFARVAKLYRMSSQTESSPHEAEIALRRCQALMARFGITEADLQTSAFGATAFRATANRVPAHVSLLSSAVALLHDCVVISHRELEFRGYAVDAEVAGLTFAYLTDAMERSLVRRKRDGSVAAGRRAGFDYRVGFAASVLTRCRAIDAERREMQESESSAQRRALVVKKLEIVREECTQGMSSKRVSPIRVRAGNALEAGGADGRSVSLNTQVVDSTDHPS